jgi:hypothetical protein
VSPQTSQSQRLSGDHAAGRGNDRAGVGLFALDGLQFIDRERAWTAARRRRPRVRARAAALERIRESRQDRSRWRWARPARPQRIS